jgi:hypothetical protein
MPRLEEVQYYFRGLWLLLMGRLEGFGWLDFSERGFWRSWWAVVYCLPAMMLSWAGLRMYYLSTMPAGAAAGPTYVAKLITVDAATWIISYLALAIAMLLSGYASRILPMIIAINWLSVPLQWLGICGSLVLIFSPGNLDLYQSVGLPLLLVSAAAHFMVIRQIADRKVLPASTFLLTLIVADIWSTSAAGDALNIWPS